jgi:hypothetical protein
MTFPDFSCTSYTILHFIFLLIRPTSKLKTIVIRPTKQAFLYKDILSGSSKQIFFMQKTLRFGAFGAFLL